MASSDLEIKAKEAFIDDHFELAVDLYTQAIALNPNHAELYADRAQANLKLDNLTGTLMAFFFREYSWGFVERNGLVTPVCLVREKTEGKEKNGEKNGRNFLF